MEETDFAYWRWTCDLRGETDLVCSTVLTVSSINTMEGRTMWLDEETQNWYTNTSNKTEEILRSQVPFATKSDGFRCICFAQNEEGRACLASARYLWVAHDGTNGRNRDHGLEFRQHDSFQQCQG